MSDSSSTERVVHGGSRNSRTLSPVGVCSDTDSGVEVFPIIARRHVDSTREFGMVGIKSIVNLDEIETNLSIRYQESEVKHNSRRTN